MKMAGVIYKVQCKDCPDSYIGKTTRPLKVRIKEHHAKADKVTKARAFTSQERKGSQAEEYKSAVAEHAAIENHTLDWDNTKKLEQVPDWRMRGIKEAIIIRSTPNNFNRP